MPNNAERIYPSIEFEQIDRAVNHFLSDTFKEDKAKAKHCLELVKYGLDNTFAKYEDHYWIYDSNLVQSKKKDYSSTGSIQLSGMIS